MTKKPTPQPGNGGDNRESFNKENRGAQVVQVQKVDPNFDPPSLSVTQETTTGDSSGSGSDNSNE